MLWRGNILVLLLLAGLISTADISIPCDSMRPSNIEIATKEPPYKVTFADISVSTGDDIEYRLKVTVESTKSLKFRGVVLQARYISKSLDTTKAVGKFDAIDGYLSTCATEYGNGLIFEGAPVDLTKDVNTLSFVWTAPSHIDTFGIYFIASIVDENLVLWEHVKSVPVFEVYRTNKAPPPFTIDTSTCGRSKGCYRAPAGCSPEITCDFILTWRTKEKSVKFEMAGKSSGWVALGLSDDKKMGDEDVIECAYNETRQRYNLPSVEIRHSINYHKSNELVRAAGLLTDTVAYLRDRRIRCTFTRLIEGNSVLSTLKDSYHLLLAQGRVDTNGNKLRHHVQLYKFPHVTPSKVSLLEIADLSGRARYPWAKLHGIVMVIAWMMSASTAMLMAKYYKPMWPNHDMCKQKVWFALHRGCMSVTFVFTIIGIIIIFIHAGGYSTMPELPDKAHPILGLITAILCIINPFIALCRCDTESKRRPIFNFIHWLVGVIPTILATPTMFIGVNLAKARVPGWTTWCLVIFALFHLIIDLMLMIHDLINTNKNKEREQEFMIHKKHDHRGELYGKEMNPVGTQFKTRIFFLYIIVVGILGLLVIIGIATG